MARFFFNFRRGETLQFDEEGTEFDTVELAFLAAFEAGRDMWRELMLERSDPATCAFEVSDSAGRSLFHLPFSEIAEVCGDPVAECLHRRSRRTQSATRRARS